MKRIVFHLLTALALLGQSCIKEDTSSCNSELLLRFQYTLNNEYMNRFDAEVQRITVYVFDNNGNYVDCFTEQGDKLTNKYVMRLPLPEGKYSVIALGGNFNTYLVGELTAPGAPLNTTLRKGITNINDFRAELKSIHGAENYLYPTSTPDDLYAGLGLDALSTPNNLQIKDIELIKDTKKIKVKITGTNFIGVPLTVYITALNGRYTYENNIDFTHPIFKYTPINSLVQPNYTEVDLKMMRLILGQSPMLVIKNSITSEVIYNENMIEQILATYKYVLQADFDRKDQFTFEINIQPKNNTIEISTSINGWKINSINPAI